MKSSIWQDSEYPGAPMDPDHQIRVLHLLPGDFNDEIRCELRVQSIDCVEESKGHGCNGDGRLPPQLPFDALSYAWGDKTRWKYVWLYDDSELPVTENLYNALRRLRWTTGTRRLWVDQLCIDQNNIRERNRQVSHMDCIYKHAGNVLIWLGDAKCSDNEPPQKCRHKYKQLVEAILDTEPSWWTRAWVVQEFAMARYDRIFCFGTCTMRYTEFKNLFLSHYFKSKLLLRRFPIDTISPNFVAFDKIAEPRDTYPFIFRVWILAITDCENPVDKLYSLLTLMSDEEKAFIKPDYDRSIETVYSEATYASIAASRSLSTLVLVHATGSRVNKHLPSWTIDFESPRKKSVHLVPLKRTHLNWYHDWSEKQDPISADDFGLDEKMTMPWCKSRPECDANVFFDCEQLTLMVKALEFDRVSLAFDVDCDSDLVSWSQEFVRPEKSRTLYSSGERAAIEMIMRHISDGDPYTRLSAQRRSNSTDQESERTLAVQGQVKLGMISRLLRKWDEAIRGEVHPVGTLPIARCAVAIFHGATIFVTEAGFLGLGPPGIHQNDLITLPYGSRYPVALREIGDGGMRWEFRGLTYVHGVMEGEILERLPNIQLEEKEFVVA